MKIFFSVILFAIAQSTHCQEIKTIFFTDNTSKKELYVDEDNNFWYSVYDGIVKDMGNSKIIFPINNPSFKRVFYTHDIVITQDGKLLSCHTRGFNILDTKTGTSKWIKINIDSKGFNTAAISIKQDSYGKIWLTTDSLYIISYDCDGKMEYYDLNQILNLKQEQRNEPRHVSIEEILQDGSLIIRIGGQWLKFKDNKIELLLETENDTKDSYSFLSHLMPNGLIFPENSSGNYFFDGNSYNYYYIKSINRQVITSPFKKREFLFPKLTNQSQNYFKGIAQINDKQVKLYELKEEKGYFFLKLLKKHPFKSKIRSTYVDIRNNLFIQTDDGFEKINSKNFNFSLYLVADPNDESQLPYSCRGLTEDSKGNIYIYTYEGFHVLKRGESKFEKINLVRKGKEEKPIESYLYNFYAQNDTIIWGYGYSDHLDQIDLATNTITSIQIPTPNGNTTTVYDIIKWENNTLLLAGEFGLLEFNLKTYLFESLNYLISEFNPDYEKTVFKLYRNRKKTELWLGTRSDGVIRINLVSNKTMYYHSKVKHLNPYDNDVALVSDNNPYDNDVALVSDNVKCFYEADDQTMWVGTEKGLQKILADNSSGQKFTVLNGMKNDNITSIMGEGDNIWIGTYDGLVKLNTKDNSTYRFSKEDGLPHNEFNNRSYFKTRDSTFYFGTINGLVSFNPSEINATLQPNQIFLTELELFDKTEKRTIKNNFNLGEIQSLEIPYNNNYLNLNFSVNEIFESEKIQYQYKIKELQDTWLNNKNSGLVRLLGLDSGNYTLKVRAFSSKGIETNTLTYKIKVKKVFYKTSLFLVSTLFILTLALGYWFLTRKKQIENRYNQKIKVNRLEAKALRSQMNPHFIFNTLNSIQSIMILKGEKEANKIFGAFSHLIRQTLDMSKSEFVFLKDEIKYLNSYLRIENTRLDNQLDISFYVDPDLDIVNVKIPCMLIQPIIENAIIHGLKPKKNNRKLKIIFKKLENSIETVIIDNGIGVKASKAMNHNIKNYKSWATNIMNERINVLNSKEENKISYKIIDINKNNGETGTKAILIIPLKSKL